MWQWWLLIIFLFLSQIESAAVNRTDIIRHRRRSTTTTTTTTTTAKPNDVESNLKVPHVSRRPQHRREAKATTTTTTTTTTQIPLETLTFSAKRRMIPRRKNATVYHFTTGKIEKIPVDLNISTSSIEEVKVSKEQLGNATSNLEQPMKPIVVADLNDAISEGSHQDAKTETGDKKFEAGKGEEHHAEKHEIHGEKGDKGYKGEHHYEKGSKGHHDKEDHKGEYLDEHGTKKGHHEGGGHFEAGEHALKGEKNAEHGEKEEFKKGHSTRGGHVVHKKDEYEKKEEFWDEFHDGGEGEKYGTYYEEFGGKKGGHKKGGHKEGASSHGDRGKKGHFEKSKSYKEDKGHDRETGKEGHYGHMEKYGKKHGHDNFKKYHYDTKPHGNHGHNGHHGHHGHHHGKASKIVYYAVPKFHPIKREDTGPVQFIDKADAKVCSKEEQEEGKVEEGKAEETSPIQKAEQLLDANLKQIDYMEPESTDSGIDSSENSKEHVESSNEDVNQSLESEEISNEKLNHLKGLEQELAGTDSTEEESQMAIHKVPQEEESQTAPHKVPFFESSLEKLWQDFLKEAYGSNHKNYLSQ